MEERFNSKDARDKKKINTILIAETMK